MIIEKQKCWWLELQKYIGWGPKTKLYTAVHGPKEKRVLAESVGNN